MKLFNASLEMFKIQVYSRGFRFLPRQSTEVPDDMVRVVYEATRKKGVFIIYPGMGDDGIKAAQRAALLEYLSATIRPRIKNYISQEDDYKKAGITLTRVKDFNDALRWEKEIVYLLELEAPIEAELSFLDAENRKKLGYDNEHIQFVADEGLFDPKNIVQDNNFEEVPKLRPGRPKKVPTSFDNLEIEQ